MTATSKPASKAARKTTKTAAATPAKKAAAAKKAPAKRTPASKAPATSPGAGGVEADRVENYDPSPLTQAFVLEFDLSRINPNPYNVRDRAIADDELIESIRSGGLVEPLVVAPAILDGLDGAALAKADTSRDHDLVAGHRRLDALDRLGVKTAPVIIRYDLDDRAKQVKTMLIENDRRQNLTPIEQAKGYRQLTLFGVSQTEVAKQVGVDRKTVGARLKLLDLNTNVQTKVTDGQVTIDQAIAIAALPAAEQSKVAKAAGTWSFDQTLAQTQRRVKKTAEVDTLAAELTKAGIPERTLPAGKSLWNINDPDDGMVRLGLTFSSNTDDHPGCLAWIRVPGPEIEYVCTNIAAHDEQLTERQRNERQEAEKAAAEAKAREEAEDLARGLRTAAVLGSVKPGVKIDPGLEQVLRVLLHQVLLNAHPGVLQQYYMVLDLPDDEQWEIYSSQWTAKDVTAFARHTGPEVKTADVVRRLVAATAAAAEDSYWPYLGDRGPRSPYGEQAQRIASRYLDTAIAAGHQLTDVERDLLAPDPEQPDEQADQQAGESS